MTATIDSKDLTNAVGWAMRAVPHKTPVPVLSAVALTVSEGELTAAGFDYDTYARSRVPADGQLDTMHVPGAMLAKLAPQMSGPVAFTVEGKGLRVTSGKDKYRLPIMPADDYPTTPNALDA